MWEVTEITIVKWIKRNRWLILRDENVPARKLKRSSRPHWRTMSCLTPCGSLVQVFISDHKLYSVDAKTSIAVRDGKTT